MVECPHFSEKSLRLVIGDIMIKMCGGGEQLFLTEEYRSFLKEKSSFSEAKINRICYTVESILNDITKLGMLIGFGSLMGKVELTASLILTYVSLRAVLGGAHMKTYWGCFFSMLYLLISAMIVCQYSTFGGAYTVVYTLFLSMIGIRLGPISSPRKKKMDESTRQRKRKIAAGIHIALLVIIMLCKKEEMRDGILAGLWLVHGQIIYLTIKNGDKTKWKMY